MTKTLSVLPRSLIWLAGLSIGVGVLIVTARAGQPKINFIERFLDNYVTIHFDTEPNLTYELQYTETLTNGVPGGTWTNLFVSPNIDSPNHYVVVDTGTRPQRFYRLRVTP